MMRIRFFLLIAITTLFAVSLTTARPKRAKKAGTVENGTFVDKTYGFTIVVPDGWEIKTGKEDEPLRLSLVKEKYERPKDRELQAWGPFDLFAAPLLGVWVFESDLLHHQFLDSMLSFDYNPDLKRDMILYVHPNWDDAFLNSYKAGERKSAEFDNHDAVFWTGIFDFRAKEGMSDREVPIGGAMISIQADDDHLMILLFRAEPEYTDRNLEELRPIFESIKFADSEKGQ